MEVRRYKAGEEVTLWHLFYNTVHHINVKHYNQDQVNAWAPHDFDLNTAVAKIRNINPYVVTLNQNIVGYANIQINGYIDHFFCHHQFQGQGVGSFLFEKLKSIAINTGTTELSVDASITAKPFFVSKGFSVEQEQSILLRGQKFINFKMIYHLK